MRTNEIRRFLSDNTNSTRRNWGRGLRSTSNPGTRPVFRSHWFRFRWPALSDPHLQRSRMHDGCQEILPEVRLRELPQAPQENGGSLPVCSRIGQKAGRVLDMAEKEATHHEGFFAGGWITERTESSVKKAGPLSQTDEFWFEINTGLRMLVILSM